jgi:hypothetical protein
MPPDYKALKRQAERAQKKAGRGFSFERTKKTDRDLVDDSRGGASDMPKDKNYERAKKAIQRAKKADPEAHGKKAAEAIIREMRRKGSK